MHNDRFVIINDDNLTQVTKASLIVAIQTEYNIMHAWKENYHSKLNYWEN